MEIDGPDKWYKEGNELIRNGKNEDAIAAYDKATQINPDHVSAWNNKGIAMFRLKRFEDAISCYDQVIGRDPNYANAWYNKAKAIRGLAQSYLDKANNDRTSAAKLINKALGLFDSANECYSKAESLSDQGA
ncbi:MAG: tetratricopeptide repeat protein [Thaumarchaeota archaeon]|nr:MAG: tetratricopeptide repeat protein [Nitrososphaerota archaeon]TLX95970.1 MAG: tetratricopeptide repeat protein [Nitrososphaerota archaeon]